MSLPSAFSWPVTVGGDLPMDALCEILLRLPAKELCRLHTVCRPWRSLLSDPQFIAAHAARHPGTLIVAGYDTSDRDEGILCDIIDLSGRVVKQIHSTGQDEWVIFVQLDLICVAKGSSMSCRLPNPATGDVFALLEGLAEEHRAPEQDIYDYWAAIVFGQVDSTVEYKVFRVLDKTSFDGYPEQLCEVFTLGGSSDVRWRGKEACPDPVSMHHLRRVVVNGIVYFFRNEVFFNPRCCTRSHSFI
uniref:F-box domain-containing protein n=1 Tax=Arundo donax TaxID=35708 RepID=A0A0A9CQD4_ARUDO